MEADIPQKNLGSLTSKTLKHAAYDDQLTWR